MNKLLDLRGSLDLAALRPLLAEPAGTVRPSAWWRHAPFSRWLLLTLRPHLAVGEGEAFAGVQEIAHAAGMVTEWGGAAEGQAELLVLDGRWDEDHAAAVGDGWRGRLAAGAAVLVHGINPGHGGSLVWARWLAFEPAAPRFALADGAGLGLLLHEGAHAHAALRALCALPPAEAADFAALCAALGTRWTARAQDAAMAMTVAELRRAVERERRWSERIGRRCDELQNQMSELRETTLRGTAAAQAEQAEARQLQAAELARQSARAAAAERALADMRASAAWRLARVLIALSLRLPPRLRVAIRRTGRLLWWLVRGRPVAELRRHRQARRHAARLRASPLFDPAWYQRTYPDLAGNRLDPALHFAMFGAAENRDGSPAFDARWYLSRYPEVAAAGMNPLLHYLAYGVREGREWRVPAALAPTQPGPEPPAIAEAWWTPAGREPAREADPFAPPTTPPAPAVAAGGALGRDLPRLTLLPVVVGLAMRSTKLAALRRALDSADAALDGIGQSRPGGILVADDGAAAELGPLTSWRVSCLPPRGRPGLAAAHNRLMEAAFSAGAEVYVAAHPGGAFAPDAIVALLRMVRANGRRALVEAARTPCPVPKPVGAGAQRWSVPWSSAACLAIPRTVYDAIGGFDPELASWGADIDYSWRARAAGFSLLACPDAGFELAFRDAEEPIPAAYLAGGVLLARKWRLPGAEAHLRHLLDQAGGSVPDVQVAELPEATLAAELPEATLAAADFGSGPFFGEPEW